MDSHRPRRPVDQVNSILRSLFLLVRVLTRHPVGQPAFHHFGPISLTGACQPDLVRHLDPDREVPWNPQPYVSGGNPLDDDRNPSRDGAPFRADVLEEVPTLISAWSPGEQRLQYLTNEPISFPPADIRASEVVDVDDHRPGQCRRNPSGQHGLAGRTLAVNPDPTGASSSSERGYDGGDWVYLITEIHHRPHRASAARAC
jgi:hypothetical protein